MSAIGKTSKNDNLIVFKEYLQHRPTGKEPPITIKAKDLDENFALTTVIENPDETDDKKSYRVKYGEEGTYLELVPLPKGQNKGDILYWDPEQGDAGEWVVLSSPTGSSLRVLTISNRELSWTETEDC